MSAAARSKVRPFPGPVSQHQRFDSALRLLDTFNRLLSESLGLEAMARKMADVIAANVSDCTIDLAGDGGTIRRVAVGIANPAHKTQQQHILQQAPDPAGNHPAAYAIRTGKARLVADLLEDFLRGATRSPEHLAIVKSMGLHSAVALPLIARRKTIGALTLIATQEQRRYTWRDAAWARVISQHCALMLGNAQLLESERIFREEAESAGRRQERLRMVAQELMYTRTVADAAAVILHETLRATGAWNGVLHQVVQDGKALVMIGSVGLPPEIVRRYTTIPVDSEFMLGDAVRKRVPVYLQNADEMAARYPHVANFRRMIDGGAFTALPLLVEGKVIGCLGLSFPRRVRPDDADRAFMNTLAAQCALTLERVQLLESLEQARHLAEERLEVATHAQHQLMLANGELEAFERHVAHDLRNGLSSILLGATGLKMAEKSLSPVGERAINSVIGGANRLSAATAALLRLSTTVSHALLKEQMDVGVLVDEVAATAAKGQEAVRITRDEMPVVEADAALLGQVFDNLLRNSVKYSRDAAQPTIHVGYARENGEHRFWVRDNGVGFDMSKAGTLFHPFTRLHADGEFEGNGVGLALVRRIVERHGGRVWAESAPGKGATFSFTLPQGAPADVSE